MTETVAYKFLRPDGRGPFSGFDWPLPNGGPGAWVEASESRSLCRAGIHACEAQHLPLWIWEELWEIELMGDVESHDHKLRAGRGRLLRQVERWSPATAKRFAVACARGASEAAAHALEVAGLAREAAPFAEPKDLVAVREATAELWDRLPSRRGSRSAWPATVLCGR